MVEVKDVIWTKQTMVFLRYGSETKSTKQDKQNKTKESASGGVAMFVKSTNIAVFKKN